MLALVRLILLIFYPMTLHPTLQPILKNRPRNALRSVNHLAGITQKVFIRLLLATFFIAYSARIAYSQEQKQQQAVISNPSAVQGSLYAARLEAMQFADDLAARRDLDQAWVRDVMGQARNLPMVSRLMQPPAKAFVKMRGVFIKLCGNGMPPRPVRQGGFRLPPKR